MSNNKKIIMTIMLVIIVAFTFLLFFGMESSQKNGIQVSSFIFLLIDELIAYGVVMYLCCAKNNTFSKAGFSITTFIYIAISLFVNVFLKSSFETIKSILIFNFSILLIYLFIVFMVLLFKKEN